MASKRQHRGIAGILVLCLVAVSFVGLVSADVDRQLAAGSKKSNIVPSAGEAELYNGIGDILKTGPCQADLKKLCPDETPGEGRLAACILKRVREEKQGNVVGKKIGNKCLEDVADYRMDRSTNINKDVPLARACKDDISKLDACKTKSDIKSPGSVIDCLREKKVKLGESCSKQVFRIQKEVVEDYRVSYTLYNACKDDVKNVCDDAEAGEELTCLADHRAGVTWECQNQMFSSEKANQDDIRLSVRLFNKCLLDSQKFCKDVEPGAMRVQECLEDHMDEPSFSPDCKKELNVALEARVKDFRLDAGLRTACESDLKDICGHTLEEMDGSKELQQSGITCLQTYKEELKTESCKAEVHRRLERAGRDIRFDDTLAEACKEDRAAHCKDVQPGSARVIRCLEDNRDTLKPACAAALFDHEVKMAEDIDFKYPMKKACAWEISTFCKDVPHGHARVVRCLEQSLTHEDMSRECRVEVTKDLNRMARDYRLNWRLRTNCKQDIPRLCSGLCSSPDQVCGGLVLQCLQDKQDNITNSACQEEVFYYELMEVTDYRNDVILAEACREDVKSFCSDVEPGEGRVHTCLRYHKDQISPRCRAEENKLAALEFRDIRLRPRLNKVCSEEKAVYCKDTKPGKARVIKCLMDNMAKPNFGEECKEELEKREEVVKNDYRMDVGVSSSCGDDVQKFCSEAVNKLRANATVLKCLLDNFRSLVDTCQVEMSRAVRMALWDYKPGAALTAACDDDVSTNCPTGKRSSGGSIFTIGAVGRCLSKTLVEGRKRLAPKCKDMVLAAAPKDARSYFDSTESTSALVQKLADIQNAAGLESLLVDPNAAGGSAITVTGWVAMACIVSLIVVIVGGSVMAYRRFTGADKPHTLHVKMGDA